MVKRVVTLCTGNICRSPVAAAALSLRLKDTEVSSAGLHALVGHDIDPDSREAATKLGLELGAHAARKFDAIIGGEADLILVMDSGHLDTVRRKFPNLSGKCFLLRHNLEPKDVPDPYRRGIANHFRAVELILEGADVWAKQIEILA